jgi:hypothetical protein
MRVLGKLFPIIENGENPERAYFPGDLLFPSMLFVNVEHSNSAAGKGRKKVRKREKEKERKIRVLP